MPRTRPWGGEEGIGGNWKREWAVALKKDCELAGGGPRGEAGARDGPGRVRRGPGVAHAVGEDRAGPEHLGRAVPVGGKKKWRWCWPEAKGGLGTL